MREEFEKLVAVGKIGRQHVDALVALAEAGYCFHRGWGFGRIRQVDPVFARFVIDFKDKPGHSMDLAFAAESLKPLSRDHILVRKAEDLDTLRQMAAVNHLQLIKLVIESYGGKATPDQIREVLTPDVVAEDWKKWWEVAKRELKHDGHFVVPLKKTDPLVYQAQEVSLTDRLMGEFRAAKGLKARLAVASELLRNQAELPDRQQAFAEAIELLNQEIASHQRTMPALALEGVFMRADLRAAGGVPPVQGEIDEATIWRQVEKPGRVLEQISSGKQKRALQSFRDARPDDWHTVLLDFLNTVSARLCAECVSLLIEQGRLNELKQTLARLINQHDASSELLLWLAKERSDIYADLLGPEVFRAMLTAMEQDQFNEKKNNRLRDYILNDQELLVELIESADIEIIKDLTRALQLSPCFDDMDKRSLLARIVKKSPAVQSLITSDHGRQEAPLLVSWESLDRRKREYDELVHKRIPANTQDIATALSYGDLAENHEYKAAKEMHRILKLRKEELEAQLVRARAIDFSNPRTDVVSIGTRVTVTELDTQHGETFSILGAWDFDAEKHIISYLSPIAQALLNKKAGEEVEFEMDGHLHRYRIEAIEPWQITPPTAGPSEPPSEPAAGEPVASASAPHPQSQEPGAAPAAGEESAPPLPAATGPEELVATAADEPTAPAGSSENALPDPGPTAMPATPDSGEKANPATDATA